MLSWIPEIDLNRISLPLSCIGLDCFYSQLLFLMDAPLGLCVAFALPALVIELISAEPSASELRRASVWALLAVLWIGFFAFPSASLLAFRAFG